MVNSCTCIDDAMRTNVGVNLDYATGTNNRTGADSAGGIDTGTNMSCNGPDGAEKFGCNQLSDSALANTNDGLHTGQLAEIFNPPQNWQIGNNRPTELRGVVIVAEDVMPCGSQCAQYDPAVPVGTQNIYASHLAPRIPFDPLKRGMVS